MLMLFSEVNMDSAEVITEAIEGTGKKNYFIEGIFMEGDVENRNKRRYPSAILEREMHSYKKNFIDTRRALGELGHPDGPSINADRVSHLITDMRRDGNNFIGRAKILDTPFGKIAKNFIDEGIGLGVSTRGLGSVRQRNGVNEVQEDFRLGTIDIVHDPSGPSCFVNGIMENRQFYFDVASNNWRTQEFVEDLAKDISKKPKISDKQAVAMFESFMKRLSRGAL